MVLNGVRYFPIVLAAILSCGSPIEDSGKLIALRESPMPLSLEEYFYRPSAYVLTGDAEVRSRHTVFFTDENVVLVDQYDRVDVSVVSLNGARVVNRSFYGEGPEDYTEITAAQVYNEEIYLWINNRQQLDVYGMDLGFRRRIPVELSAGSLLINDEGLFFYRAWYDPSNPAKFSKVTHDGKLIEVYTYEREERWLPPISGDMLVPLTSKSLLQYHPSSDSISCIHATKSTAFQIDFNGHFLNAAHIRDLHPLEQLKYVNGFEGYRTLQSGIRCSNNEVLFSLSYQSKPYHLLVDLDGKTATRYSQLVLEGFSLPKNVRFLGSNEKGTWFMMAMTTWEMSGMQSKVSPTIVLDGGAIDQESSVLVYLPYKR